MRRAFSCSLLILLIFAGKAVLFAQSDVVVFNEPGFPAADSAAPTPQQLAELSSDVTAVDAKQLEKALASPSSRLLVLPYGSAFPEESWSAIKSFLDRGGNLLVLGGRPFTRAAYRDAQGWHLRDYSVRFIRPLMIDQYQETPGSDELEFQSNPELPLRVATFAWKRAFSPVIRLSAVDLYHRGGSAGSLDARLNALAWGVKDGRKLSAPAIQVDHDRNGFDGGRWILVNAGLGPEFFENRELVQSLANRALNGAEEFTVRPVLPLYLPGEPVELQVNWHAVRPVSGLVVKVTVFRESQASSRTTLYGTIPSTEPMILTAPSGKGLYIIEAQLMEGERVRAIYHSGFWIRDEAYLRSGPHLTVDHDYFELDGHPLAVVGTTYMSSDVQRLYFEHPNVYVWNQDLAQIHDAGLNMIRTGWWTGWDKFCDENGQPYERTLRTLEAYLMTARRYRLPVQFNFFAFLPEVLGGINAFLDPAAVRRQRTLISAVVARFPDVPFLGWDLINEPSFSQHLWTMRPNGDPFELAAWNEWLVKRYPDRTKLAALWNAPPDSVSGAAIALPREEEFSPRGMYVGINSLKVYDYILFAQESFAKWAGAMRETIRATGSEQLVTVGQDEGGIQDRLSPAFWGSSVDFTTNHSWWQNDYILWDSLAAKQPGEAMLIQETGLQRELNLDEIARRTPENEAALLERKIATSFIQGSGAIEWLWNTNSYMTESNETPIGAVRTDYTEKPEATLLRAFGRFAPALQEHLRDPQLPSVAVITSQASQYSVLADFQLEAQRRAVRALVYSAHLPAFVIAENQIAHLGSPKLAILPSPQALTDAAWNALLEYVDKGGTLLVTGPVERDEHWQIVHRASALGVAGHIEPLVYHDAELKLGDKRIGLAFGQQQQNWLESLRFDDGSSLKEIPRGKGRIYWVTYPVELSENLQSVTALYSFVASRLNIAPPFTALTPVPSGVLVFPTGLADSTLYVFVSDSDRDAAINIRDQGTGVALEFQLHAQHAAIAVIGKKEHKVVAQYGF